MHNLDSYESQKKWQECTGHFYATIVEKCLNNPLISYQYFVAVTVFLKSSNETHKQKLDIFWYTFINTKK